jgi:hypothetical protein
MNARDAIAQQQIERELCYLKDHVAREQGYQRGDVLSQDDGLMVGFLSIWTSREDARHFHDSGVNQLLMAVTKLRITGTPVVKLFRLMEE